MPNAESEARKGAMSQMKIVPMQEEHLEQIAQLEQVCFSQPWSLEGLRAELTNDTAHFFAAELDGKIAGYAGMHGVCGEGYITNVAVFPLQRRNGVGRQLVRALAGYAKSSGYAFVSLEVRKSNMPAIALYQSEGFVPAGVRKNFYTHPCEDAVIMTKSFVR